MGQFFLSYLNILIPALISVLIGVAAHFVSFRVAKIKNETSLDMRGFESLENQLDNVLEENKILEKKLDEKDAKADELRDLKYTLELKIAMLEKEMEELKETVRVLNEENFQLKTKLSIMNSHNKKH